MPFSLISAVFVALLAVSNATLPINNPNLVDTFDAPEPQAGTSVEEIDGRLLTRMTSVLAHTEEHQYPFETE